ncbi:ribosomal protein L2 (apicoplast) [Babesia microti strain RI]|uniref:Ribosomal protein L2 n=1 Tax=Babesia microti (strain RI) TaxID=1133968 RepID=A0A068W7I4_BABMR|nr:ribosomal protein L2 [Babesia microti strain RI]CDR32588.1 ribosomal protein L2 [Babesia microti strain RI]|eukprot:YP_009363157.1 ribosomal protein L2 (apicoplast) [Babesia microti strain RI]
MINLYLFKVNRNLGRSNKGIIISRSKRSFLNNKYFIIDNYYFNLNSNNNQNFFITKVFNNYLYKNSLLIKCIYLNNSSINIERVFIKAQKINKGDIIKLFNISLLSEGDSSYIFRLSYGNIIFNIENYKTSKSTYCRSFNSFATILSFNCNYYFIKLPSSKIIKINKNCKVFLGKPDEKKINFFNKAGYSYKYGIRPIVRGKAMNVVDHPHGGGEGKTSIGRKSIYSIYGKSIKGIKTAKRK